MRRIISVVALLTLTLFAAPAMAAGPVAGVANVTTYATFPTCENPIGTLRIVKKSNTAQYTGRVTINGSTYFSFTLTKAGNTVYAFSQEINAPVTVGVVINRGGLGSVTQNTTFNPPTDCDA